MYRWCSRCNEKRNNGDAVCPICQHGTDIELDVNDTLRIDGKREFVITKQLSHFTDAGMSAVYLAARKDRPEMRGAIKVAKPARVEALHREAEVLQKLKHTHIVRLVHPERTLWQDNKDNTTLHFFALEYMDSGTLKDRLKQKQKLSIDEATPIIMAVGQALAYAHQNNYLHLDVKPANILFSSDGRIVLSDFGIARIEAQASELKKRIGTLFYNSPEQLLSPPSHTYKADIYALGIILYEMLVGTDRFRQHRTSSSSKEDSQPAGNAKTPPSLNVRPFNDLPPPRKFEPRISRAVERVILKAIAPNPVNRYDSVSAMLDDLMQAVTAPPSQKKLLLLLAGLGVLIAVALIGLGLYFIQANRSVAVADVSPTPSMTPRPEETTASGGMVVIVSTPTLLPTATPPAQASDSLNKPPTVTRAPTNTPRPVLRPSNTPTLSIEGAIELLAPTDDIQVGDTVEFRWRWQGHSSCVQPPEGYAFEIRVWPDNNTDPPMGAMNAGEQKPNIRCDSGSGIYSFSIAKIQDVPGFRGLSEGRFRWDVALVQLNPYNPIRSPAYRTFYTN